MEWDVIDSASQAVRKMEIWAIGSGVRAGFESGRTSWLGRKGLIDVTIVFEPCERHELHC